MARVYPFRALRYNPSLVRLEDVVTQPYDKITPAMQQAYYQRSPYNLVRIILGLPELFDGEAGSDIYARAAHDFSDWRKNGVLSQESEPCIFAYSQRFSVPGRPGKVHERRGLIALGEVYDYEDKVVFRHEQTLAKPKSDRLNLLRATRAHFGQIFMLYSDPGLSVDQLLFDSPNGPASAAPDIEVTDEFEVTHRVWRVSDPNIINLVTTALEDKKLIIADGHHRYETALNYAKEHAPLKTVATERRSQAAPQPAYPEAAMMMTFVNMDTEGLVILPAHRIVHSLTHFSAVDFLDRAHAFFEVWPLSGSDSESLLAELDAATEGMNFVCVTTAGSHLLTLRAGSAAEVLAGYSHRQQQLDVVVLHAVVLEKLLGLTPESIRNQANLEYLRDASEAIEKVQTKEADAAFLINAVTLGKLREMAFAGETMPQKSTDFYPKLLSGLTIYALD